MDRTPFHVELEQLINQHSMENGSNTPDFMLADYIMACLKAFETATNTRERWYGREPSERKLNLAAPSTIPPS